MGKSCPACGEDPMPFSKEVVALFKKILQTEDDLEKAELMLQLSALFVEDTAETDEDVSEEVHDVVADVVDSRMAYERHAMFLARILLRSIPQYLHQNPESEEEPSKPVEKSN